MDLEWAQPAIAIIGAICGAATGIFMGGRRVGKIESGLSLNFKQAINESKKEIEDKVEQARKSFDETLKGLRQKINDVELDTARGFVSKGDFADFREEYRDNTQRIFEKLDNLPRQK